MTPFKYLPIRRADRVIDMSEGGTFNRPDAPADTLTIEKLNATMRQFGDGPPDPLCGATILHAAENMVDEARGLAAMYSGDPFGRTVDVIESALTPPGFIVGMRGSEAVLIIGPPAKEGTP